MRWKNSLLIIQVKIMLANYTQFESCKLNVLFKKMTFDHDFRSFCFRCCIASVFLLFDETAFSGYTY